MEQSETWKDVRINPEMSDEKQEKITQLLIEFQDFRTFSQMCQLRLIFSLTRLT